MLLLAYSEDEGKLLIGGTQVDAALGGAILAELALLGRIAFVDKKVVVQDATPVDDEELNDALTRIAEDKKTRKPDWWVYKLHSWKLRKRLLTRLADRGVLGEEQVKIMGLFPSTRYPERNPSVELAVRERVQNVLSGADPDERVAVLVAVLVGCQLVRKVFPDASKARLKEITEGDWAGEAVKNTIASINAVVITAVTAGAIAGAASG
ncbi:hypothetical protein Ssi02_60760 [Sinosporangium siamense]|uniref:GPP34 family phosphoprotein n=1 Tax=Sinosporangium siamense TaxID=1367973 RepID=A0A919RL64_9ACTN|nr:hypothetical protein Ssi02_60760 [Sinosporangium siamense]